MVRSNRGVGSVRPRSSKLDVLLPNQHVYCLQKTVGLYIILLSSVFFPHFIQQNKLYNIIIYALYTIGVLVWKHLFLIQWSYFLSHPIRQPSPWVPALICLVRRRKRSALWKLWQKPTKANNKKNDRVDQEQASYTEICCIYNMWSSVYIYIYHIFI